MRVRENRSGPCDEIGRNAILHGLERIETDGSDAEPRLGVEPLELARQATFQDDIPRLGKVVAHAARERLLEEFALRRRRRRKEAANEHVLGAAEPRVAHILLRPELARCDAGRAERSFLSGEFLGTHQVDIGRHAQRQLAMARRGRDAFDGVEQTGDRLGVEGHRLGWRQTERIDRRAFRFELAQPGPRLLKRLVDRRTVCIVQARDGMLERLQLGVDERTNLLDGVAQLAALAGEKSGRRAPLLLKLVHEPTDPGRTIGEQTELARVRAQRPGL